MKLSLAIDFLTAWKAEILVSGMLAAGMAWMQSPGYAVGAVFATVALWFIARKKCPSDRISVMLFTFVTGAWGGPLLAGMERLKEIPRPNPMIGEWEALFGFLVASIFGSALYVVVIGLARRAEKGATSAVAAAARKLGMPDSETTAPDMPKMSAEEFHKFLAGLPERQREAFLNYQDRRSHGGRVRPTTIDPPPTPPPSD